jgi:hypothetical protein
MNTLQVRGRVQAPPLTFATPVSGLVAVTEALHSLAAAWEGLTAGAWTTAAVQSFAVLARRSALELGHAGCGAIERGLVELTLALDALTLADTVSQSQIERVDYAIAQLRAVTVQRMLGSALPCAGAPGEAPALFMDICPRCANTACGVVRWGEQGS